MAVCFICQGKHDGPCPRLAKLPAARKIAPPVTRPVTPVTPIVTPVTRPVTLPSRPAPGDCCPTCGQIVKPLPSTGAQRVKAHRDRKKNAPPA